MSLHRITVKLHQRKEANKKQVVPAKQCKGLPKNNESEYLGSYNSQRQMRKPHLTNRSTGRATAAHFTTGWVCGVQGFKKTVLQVSARRLTQSLYLKDLKHV